MKKYVNLIRIAVVVYVVLIFLPIFLPDTFVGVSVLETLDILFPILIIFIGIIVYNQNIKPDPNKFTSNGNKPYQELEKVFSRNPVWASKFKTFQQGVSQLQNDGMPAQKEAEDDHKPPFSSRPINRAVVVSLLILLCGIIYLLDKT